MNSLNLAIANIRNGKSAAFSLFVLTLLAIVLLNIGMTINSQVNHFYDNKVAELKDAHIYVVMKQAEFKQPYADFFRTSSEVNEFETSNAVLMNSVKFLFGDQEMSHSALFAQADAQRRISPLKLIEQLDTKSNSDIYLPYTFQVGGHYKLGDSFVITYQDEKYSFHIAGFFETTMLGTNNMGMMKFLLPEAAYRQLSNELTEQETGIIMTARLHDSTQSTQLLNDFTNNFLHNDAEESSFIWEMDIETAKLASAITINIVAMILVAFAAIVVTVALIVMAFRVTNSIEDGMVNIGVLKAIGYTSKQIVASIVFQFLLITLASSIVGIVLSYIVMPVFGNMISSLMGLNWTQSIEVGINLLSIAIVSVLVLAVTLFASIRIRKLLPVIALRGGIQTHSFRKNYFPLEKLKGSLQFRLACKALIANSKQNITIAIIMIAVTFASVFSIVLYYNVGVNKMAFIHLVGVETADVMVLANSGEEGKQIIAGMEKMDGVAKIALLDIMNAKVDGNSYYMNISDNYSKLENNTVFKGRFPKYDNEISISWLISEQLGKTIGDTVEVEVNGASYDFLVTGLSQSINNMGLIVDITLDGMQHLIPDFEGTRINVYLEGVDNEAFIHNIKAEYGERMIDAIDVIKTVEVQTGVYTTVVFVVMLMILTITIVVVLLILYLVIRTMILKRRKEFGILKATGYTTFQLMQQVAFSFIPVVIGGVLIGGLLGSMFTNSLLSLLLSSAGINNVQFTIHFSLIMLLCLVLIGLAYGISLLVSRRIKHISAYSLMTE